MARSLSIVLHAHIPYVRDPEGEHPDEQEWLFRVLSESYIPVLKMLDGLTSGKDQLPISFCICVAWSPLLAEMLADELVQDRYVRWLGVEIDRADEKCSRTKHDPPRNIEAHGERDQLVDCLKTFTHDWERDVTGQLDVLEERGCVERLDTAATHAWLPGLANVPELLNTQIQLGSDGRDGFWLPELGCSPEVAGALAANGARWTVIEPSRNDDSSPIVLEGGLVGFPASERLDRRISHFPNTTVEEGEGIHVCPVDFESLGHWRRDGLIFLEALLRQRPDGFRLESPTEYLNRNPILPLGTASLDGRAFLDGEVHPHLDQLARDTVAKALGKSPETNGDRPLVQLLRELLLAQSSDWAFLAAADGNGLGKYAKHRVRAHIARARAILDGDASALERSEAEYPIFSNLDWRVLVSRV